MSPFAKSLLVLGAVFIIVLVFVGQGWAHSFYSQACCNDRDCAPTTEVRWTEGGWFVPATGETIPPKDRRIKESPDVQIHACIALYLNKVRCLYIPGPGI